MKKNVFPLIYLIAEITCVGPCVSKVGGACAESLLTSAVREHGKQYLFFVQEEREDTCNVYTVLHTVPLLHSGPDIVI
jgi:hypothetical protein